MRRKIREGKREKMKHTPVHSLKRKKKRVSEGKQRERERERERKTGRSTSAPYRYEREG